MKSILTFSSLVVLLAFTGLGCYKQYTPSADSYWLSRERGEVVYSDSYCNYYVVQTAAGYTIIRSYGGYRPVEGSIIYGDLSYAGTQDLYNRSYSVVFTGTVVNYWLSYAEAQTAIDYYCPLGKTAQGKTISDSKSGFRKTIQ